jgi:hypothetical protein
MNLPFEFAWRIDLPPSFEEIKSQTTLSDEALADHLQQSVAPFNVTLRLHADHTFQRPFPGGTLHSLLQFLYDVYQEPMPLDEMDLISNYPIESTRERYRGYIERTLAGEPVPRIWAFLGVGPNPTVNRIRRNKIMMDDWE